MGARHWEVIAGVVALCAAALGMAGLCFHLRWRRRDRKARQAELRWQFQLVRGRLRETLDSMAATGEADIGAPHFRAGRSAWHDIDELETLAARLQLPGEQMVELHALITRAKKSLTDDRYWESNLDRKQLPLYRDQDDRVADILQSGAEH